MAWFHFSQNNSGGSFVFDEAAGITHHVLIEADDAAAATQRALSIGIYFDGCSAGRDCPCCGDRWSELWDETGDDTPMVYDQPADAFSGIAWMDDGKEIALHPLGAPIAWHGVVENAA